LKKTVGRKIFMHCTAP